MGKYSMSSAVGHATVDPQPDELTGRIEARLREAAADLDSLRDEVATLGSLAERASGRSEQMPKLLTVPQAASVLGVGQTTIHQLIRAGRLASVKIASSRRIPADAIDEFVGSLTSESVGA